MSRKKKQKVTEQSEKSADKQLAEVQKRSRVIIHDDSEAEPGSITIDVGGLIVIGVGILYIIIFGLKVMRVW